MSESVTATRVRVPIATYTLSTQLPICTRRQVFKSIAAEILNAAMKHFD